MSSRIRIHLGVIDFQRNQDYLLIVHQYVHSLLCTAIHPPAHSIYTASPLSLTCIVKECVARCASGCGYRRGSPCPAPQSIPQFLFSYISPSCSPGSPRATNSQGLSLPHSPQQTPSLILAALAPSASLCLFWKVWPFSCSLWSHLVPAVSPGPGWWRVWA